MADSPSLRAIYKVVDGCEIDTDVYLPKLQGDNPPAKCPVAIDFHGGAFMLGASDMVNKDQIADCLARGWIVLVPNFRLCPQVSMLDGPMQDSRDLLSWVYEGELDRVLSSQLDTPCRCDYDSVVAFGTSSGGHLALSLGFGVQRPVAAIFDLYGACSFSSPFWTSRLPHIAAKLPPDLTHDFIYKVYKENPVPTKGGVSLEGQAPGVPNFNDPRQAFAFTQIANGTVLDACFPTREWDKVDPALNISPQFPPTYIVHGQCDTMVSISVSHDLYAALQKHGVQCGMQEIPDEEHTFAAKMRVGSRTWDLQRKGFDFMEKVMARK